MFRRHAFVRALSNLCLPIMNGHFLFILKNLIAKFSNNLFSKSKITALIMMMIIYFKELVKKTVRHLQLGICLLTKKG